jgi:hypothetical protein
MPARGAGADEVQGAGAGWAREACEAREAREQREACELREVVLRVVASHPDRRALQLFAREIAPAGTSWSPGTTGRRGPAVGLAAHPAIRLPAGKVARAAARDAAWARRSTRAARLSG